MTKINYIGYKLEIRESYGLCHDVFIDDVFVFGAEGKEYCKKAALREVDNFTARKIEKLLGYAKKDSPEQVPAIEKLLNKFIEMQEG